MKLTASNIAWKPEEDEEAAEALRQAGARGVEIAPTAAWPRPLEASSQQVREYRKWWADRGLEISSMQALLFGKPELRIFGDESARKATFEYLAGMIRLGGALGAGALVFGSPKNRTVGSMPRAAAEDVAVAFFRGLGEIAEGCGTRLCIEPNPPEYGADFVTTSAEGLALVRKAGSKGFCLHLDAGGMTMAKDPLSPEVFAAAAHFHASEPHLAPVGGGGGSGTNHAAFGSALKAAGYQGWISIEMRAAGERGNVEPLRRALKAVVAAYA